jgi:hypothetical protein
MPKVEVTNAVILSPVAAAPPFGGLGVIAARDLLVVLNREVSDGSTPWYDGTRWNRNAIEAALAKCEPESPWERRALAPPVSPDEIADFEDRFGVELPPEYRSFLIEVSAGGPGPGYGLYQFDRSDLDEALGRCSWNNFTEPTEFYRSPFPFTAPTSLTAEEVERDPEVADRQLEGTWVLADYGCAIYMLLVLSGPSAGQLWWSDGLDLSPADVSFVDWYTTWLDRFVAVQNEVSEIRTGWSSYITTRSWFTRVIHNAIRDHDPEHKFLTLASTHDGLFNIDSYDALAQEHRADFLGLLSAVAADLESSRADAPAAGEFTSSAAAELLRDALRQLEG